MYDDDAIDSVDSISPNQWEFGVTSERVRGMVYEVSIRIQNGRVTYHDCDCPYNFGPICKHVVACLYEIRETGLYGRNGGWDAGRYSDSEEEEEEQNENNSEEETDDEGETSMEVDRIINERKLAKEAKERQLAQKKKEKPERMLSRKEGEDFVENEFHCQVCLEVMDDPVLMSCNAHSMCYDCALLMFKHNPKQAGGHKLISCPTCRESSGVLKIKKVKDIKINLEMKRIKEAYDNERKAWSQEKETLQEIVSQVGNSQEEDSRDESYKKKKVSGIKKEIDEMDTKMLQEVATKILIKLKSKGVKIDKLVDSVMMKKDSKESSPKEDKRRLLKRKVDKITNKENTDNKEEKEERYPLRSLKRLKTTTL